MQTKKKVAELANWGCLGCEKIDIAITFLSKSSADLGILMGGNTGTEEPSSG